MATFESLSGLFEEFGFELSAEVIGRCKLPHRNLTFKLLNLFLVYVFFFFIFFFLGLDLCNTYDIVDPKEFVEIYVAFSVNHLNGGEPSLSTLSDFERKELSSNKSKAKEPVAKKHVNLDDFDNGNDIEDDDVMDAYICKTPKVCQLYFIRNSPVIFIVEIFFRLVLFFLEIFKLGIFQAIGSFHRYHIKSFNYWYFGTSYFINLNYHQHFASLYKI